LFQKKIKELLVDVLDNNTDFWLNPNYSETVCYRVTRTDKFTGKKAHWFVPNFSQLGNIQLFDSNGRFNRGQDITYEVFSLKATIGVDYHYVLDKSQQEKLDAVLAKEKPKFNKDGSFNPKKDIPANQFSDIPGTLKYFDYVCKKGTYKDLTDYFSNYDKQLDSILLSFVVDARPSIRFIEVPYIQKSGVIIYDSAPASPNISLFPYRGIDNKITAVFGGYIDQYVAKKESILVGEDDINDKAEKYSRQFYRFAKDELHYKSEMEDVDYFEMLVLQKQPHKIEDFEDSQVIRIKNTFDPLIISSLEKKDKPHGTSYTLSVDPNKDYWVTTRIVDFTGNVSNTSPVYKINITNDDGYINPTFGVYDMTEVRLPKEISTTPEFSRLLYVAPAPEHAAPFKSEKSIDIGLGSTQPYKKTYKIRITSKKTNKKIDINVFFEKKVKTIKSPKELPKGYEYEQVTYALPDKKDIVEQFDFEYGEIGLAAGYDSDEQNTGQ
jgi:hypothetical protein